MSRRGQIIIAQGGQWGSEGKGQVASELVWRRGCSYAVRTGSINAGHTVHYKGIPFVMQIIPTAWVLPGVQLVLGAGCFIEPDILAREVAMVNQATGEDICARLVIDSRCAWFGDMEAKRAKDANRHHAMGATGKGGSEAIVSKIYDRGDTQPGKRLFINRPGAFGIASPYVFADTVKLLDAALERGESILLEGTQGALLDFNLGPYPYVTSRMTNAAAWLAEAGLPPRNVEVALIVRSHPIRVAGNSGPMPLETSWPSLTRELNRSQLDRDLDPVVPEWAIVEFETTLRAVVDEYFPEVALDPTIDPLDRINFHLWSPSQRVRHRVCISEANAATLKKLPQDTLAFLRFFEKTTVTKKLRRIAHFDFASVEEAIRMNRPEYLVYTFLNYDFPHLTNATDPAALEDTAVALHLSAIESRLGVKIRYVTTGPKPEHQLPTHHDQTR